MSNPMPSPDARSAATPVVAESEFLGAPDPETGLRPLKQLSKQRKRRNQTLFNMVWSMGIIIITVLVLVLVMSFRNSGIEPATTGSVDITQTVDQVGTSAGYPLVNPQLGDGWRATLVRFDGASDPAFVLGFTDPDSGFAQMTQVKTLTPGFLSAELGPTTKSETTTIAGMPCETYTLQPTSEAQGSKEQFGVSCQGEASGAVVLGTSSSERLTEYMTAIAPTLQSSDV